MALKNLYDHCYHYILAAGKLRSIGSNKTQLEGTIITSLIQDNLTEISLNIFGQV